MRAVHFNAGRINFCSDTPHAPAERSMIDVKVLKAGICETDLQLKQGYMGFSGIPGHEFVGVAQSGKFAGRRVVGEINCACSRCDFCNQGRPRHCRNRAVIGILNHPGAFADLVRVPEENLHVVPDHISPQQAVFTKPVAAACRILEQVAISGRHRVVIYGDGRLGNLCAQVLKTTGCRLTVVGKHQWKLNFLNTLQIETALLNSFSEPASADIVVDCTGSPSGLPSAMQTVRPCGTIILKTTVAAQQSLHMAPVVIDEFTVLGSRCGPFAPALEMIADGRVRVDDMISAEYALEDAVAAFEHAERPDSLKVLFSVCSDDSCRVS